MTDLDMPKARIPADPRAVPPREAVTVSDPAFATTTRASPLFCTAKPLGGPLRGSTQIRLTCAPALISWAAFHRGR